MTKARVLPLPVTCSGEKGLVCFPWEFTVGKQGRLHRHQILTASAATSLFFMNRGMVAD